MKYYSGESLFAYTWDQLVNAFWQRYPNPYSKHVLSEDVLERKIVGNKLFSKRIICKSNKVPKWAGVFTGGQKSLYVLEESIVDINTQTFITYTRNIGMQKIMSIDEKCTYSASKTEPTATVCERQAWVNSSVTGFTSLISSFGVKRFKKNADKAALGYKHVLETMYGPMQEIDNPVVEQKTKTEILREQYKAKAAEAKEKAKSGVENVKSKAKSGAENVKSKAKSGAENVKLKAKIGVEKAKSKVLQATCDDDD